MLFSRRKKPRQFSYTPFYSKENDESDGEQQKIKFKRPQRIEHRKAFPVWIIFLLLIVLAVFYLLQKLVK